MHQVFSLEVRKEINGRVLASLHSQPIPHFTVSGLSPGKEYFLGVYANNTQGVGPIVNLAYHTPIDIAEKRLSADAADGVNDSFKDSKNSTSKFMSPALIIALGVTSGVVLVILIIIVVIKVKGVRCRVQESKSELIYTRTSIADENQDENSRTQSQSQESLHKKSKTTSKSSLAGKVFRFGYL